MTAYELVLQLLDLINEHGDLVVRGDWQKLNDDAPVSNVHQTIYSGEPCFWIDGAYS